MQSEINANPFESTQYQNGTTRTCTETDPTFEEECGKRYGSDVFSLPEQSRPI
ncbi:hypothetical protein DPMN_084787 [Dreissena polymorpha]|uniref:Uncharacterized protein n=1 Tax=Dreissena polymorpha TaxID=45954 RepID=A0A9D3YDT0_DREPO|nr:hypothetical protein DPMN_084787 [Dreissena polymorpha]